MEQTKGYKKRGATNLIQCVILTIVLFSYLVIVLANYASDVKKDICEDVEEKLLSHAAQISQTFMKEISYGENAASVVASVIALGSGKVTNQENLDLLSQIMKSSHAIDGYVADSGGYAWFCSGKRTNVAKTAPFAKAIMKTSHISDVYLDEDSGRYVISIAVPILGENTVKGIVSLTYPADRFENIPRTGEHDGRTQYMLVSRDGTIANSIGVPNTSMGDSVFDVISDRDDSSESVAKKLERAMKNGKSGSLWCTQNGEAKELVYQSAGNGLWYVMEIYSSNYVQTSINRRYGSTRSIIMRIMFAVASFITLIILINVISRAVYAKQSRELQNKAETDLLTGLLNKMATQKHIQDYLEAEGKEKNAMLCVLDIDNFKKINDTLGHAFGDQVLSTLGAGIKSEFRITDIVGRIGGDEFIIFLKDIKTDEIRVKEAERVVRFFKDFKAGDYVKYSATASIGVAMYPKDGKTFEELYKAADRGVYMAKKKGKNQLCFCDENTQPISKSV